MHIGQLPPFGVMPLFVAACGAASGLAGCSDAATADAPSDDDASEDDTDDDAGDDGDRSDDERPDAAAGSAAAVPATPGALRRYLEAESYRDFSAEPKIHPTSGPHASRVRVFINHQLESSLEAGQDQHPAGSAAIKELYDSDEQRVGWAAMVKLDSGEGGDSWFWYELLNGSVLADEPGRTVCVNCHRPGADFFVTVYPFD